MTGVDLDAIRRRHAERAYRPGLNETRDDIDALLATIAEVKRVVNTDAEWDIRIHRSAQARTTLRGLLGEVRADA